MAMGVGTRLIDICAKCTHATGLPGRERQQSRCRLTSQWPQETMRVQDSDSTPVNDVREKVVILAEVCMYRRRTDGEPRHSQAVLLPPIVISSLCEQHIPCQEHIAPGPLPSIGLYPRQRRWLLRLLSHGATTQFRTRLMQRLPRRLGPRFSVSDAIGVFSSEPTSARCQLAEGGYDDKYGHDEPRGTSNARLLTSLPENGRNIAAAVQHADNANPRSTWYVEDDVSVNTELTHVNAKVRARLSHEWLSAKNREMLIERIDESVCGVSIPLSYIAPYAQQIRSSGRCKRVVHQEINSRLEPNVVAPPPLLHP